jgi:hypothetical protein
MKDGGISDEKCRRLFVPSTFCAIEKCLRVIMHLSVYFFQIDFNSYAFKLISLAFPPSAKAVIS